MKIFYLFFYLIFSFLFSAEMENEVITILNSTKNIDAYLNKKENINKVFYCNRAGFYQIDNEEKFLYIVVFNEKAPDANDLAYVFHYENIIHNLAYNLFWARHKDDINKNNIFFKNFFDSITKDKEIEHSQDLEGYLEPLYEHLITAYVFKNKGELIVYSVKNTLPQKHFLKSIFKEITQ